MSSGQGLNQIRLIYPCAKQTPVISQFSQLRLRQWKGTISLFEMLVTEKRVFLLPLLLEEPEVPKNFVLYTLIGHILDSGLSQPIAFSLAHFDNPRILLILLGEAIAKEQHVVGPQTMPNPGLQELPDVVLELRGQLLDDDVAGDAHLYDDAEGLDLRELLLREVVEVTDAIGPHGQDVGGLGQLGLDLRGVDGEAEAEDPGGQQKRDELLEGAAAGVSGEVDPNHVLLPVGDELYARDQVAVGGRILHAAVQTDDESQLEVGMFAGLLDNRVEVVDEGVVLASSGRGPQLQVDHPVLDEGLQDCPDGPPKPLPSLHGLGTACEQRVKEALDLQVGCVQFLGLCQMALRGEQLLEGLARDRAAEMGVELDLGHRPEELQHRLRTANSDY